MEYKDFISLILYFTCAASEDVGLLLVVGHECYKLCTDIIKLTLSIDSKLQCAAKITPESFSAIF